MPVGSGTPDLIRHAVLAIAKQYGGDTSKAFPIAIAQLQKAGYLKAGTQELTAAGKKKEAEHEAEPDAEKKLKAYEKLLKANRKEESVGELPRGFKSKPVTVTISKIGRDNLSSGLEFHISGKVYDEYLRDQLAALVLEPEQAIDALSQAGMTEPEIEQLLKDIRTVKGPLELDKPIKVKTTVLVRESREDSMDDFDKLKNPTARTGLEDLPRSIARKHESVSKGESSMDAMRRLAGISGRYEDRAVSAETRVSKDESRLAGSGAEHVQLAKGITSLLKKAGYDPGYDFAFRVGQVDPHGMSVDPKLANEIVKLLNSKGDFGTAKAVKKAGHTYIVFDGKDIDIEPRKVESRLAEGLEQKLNKALQDAGFKSGWDYHFEGGLLAFGPKEAEEIVKALNDTGDFAPAKIGRRDGNFVRIEFGKAESIEEAASASDFWKFVDEADWGGSGDYDAISEKMFAKYGAKKMEEFNAVFRKLKDALGKAVEKWEKAEGKRLPIGDDGYDDLRAHIIGLGKAEYDLALKSPEKVYSRAKNGTYEESFAYVFHKPQGYSESRRVTESEDVLRPDQKWLDSLSDDAESMGMTCSMLTQQLPKETKYLDLLKAARKAASAMSDLYDACTDKDLLNASPKGK